MRRGVRLALDVGDVRIGVARCDVDATVAVPVETVHRGPRDVQRIAELIAEYEPIELVVGLPLRMDGTEGPAAHKIREWLAQAGEGLQGPAIRLVDERLSTVSAQSGLHASGRSVKSSRAVIDQAAAVVILESALARERATGEPAGEQLWRR